MFKIPEKIKINGGKPVSGKVRISGAKNSVMGLMAASLLTREKVVLKNVPFISDVLLFGSIMDHIGVGIQHNPETREMEIEAKTIKTNIIPAEASKKIRGSYYFWSALLARFAITKEFDSLVVVSPGGCKIGESTRKYDFHIKLLEKVLGVTTEEKLDKDGNALLVFTLPENKKMDDKLNYFSTVRMSHGATMNFLLASVGNGTISMLNASQEPEIEDLINMLNLMGKDIIKINGRNSSGLVKNQINKPSLLKGVTYVIMADRLEAASYALLAAATGGEIFIEQCDANTLTPFLNRFKHCADVRIMPNGIFVSAHKDYKDVPLQHMLMTPYPGDETDLHQLWAPLLLKANGVSEIIDPIWIARIVHMPELAKMGAKFEAEIVKSEESHSVNSYSTGEHAYIKIHGNPEFEFKAADMEGPDLRGTCALVWAACAAKGVSTVGNAKWAIRGYPNLVRNLRNLGVDVEEIGEDKESSIPLLPILEVEAY